MRLVVCWGGGDVDDPSTHTRWLPPALPPAPTPGTVPRPRVWTGAQVLLRKAEVEKEEGRNVDGEKKEAQNN